MNTKRIGRNILVSLLVTAAVWTLMAWPLPRFATCAIPSSAANIEKDNMRMMIPGDHLQLLYQLWIGADTFRGHTPWFCDPYEFNTGNDRDNSFLSTYYLPFSLFFTLGDLMGGQAVGYNLDQFIALWLTYLFTWLLVRRYIKDEWLSGVTAILSIIFPYRWITMLDGSPTGLAMMWVPILYWSLDVMVAERKVWAGAVAGLALYVSEWGDTHVFFFTVMSTPFWCLFSYLFHSGFKWPSRREMLSLLRAASLLGVFVGLVAFQGWRIQQGLKHTVIAESGRSLHEVALCSLPLSGVVKFHNPQDNRKIYMGVYLIALLGAGWIAYLRGRRRGLAPNLCAPLPLALLSLAVVGLVMLSSGAQNPGGPHAWRLLTRLIPPYGSIRQADKIYCLMPVVLAVSCGLLWPGLLGCVPASRRKVASLALLAPLLLDYQFRINPTICGLDREQGAFRAVAEDAKAEGNGRPHVIILPLWPGDSHFTSLDEYYISLYHLRMINGYGGSAKPQYLDDIVLPLESMNIGGIYDAQLDALLKRGVGYVILHEDTFPEPVSPFPVGYTLQQLLNQPRLHFLGKEGSVWAFKIQPAPDAVARPRSEFMTFAFPSRRRELERSILTNGAPITGDASAMGGSFARLNLAGGSVEIPATQAALDMPLCWLIRARGKGSVGVETILDGVTNTPVLFAVDSDQWTWPRIPIAAKAASAVISARLSRMGGTVDLDSAILGAGDWKGPALGETLTLPAVCFFHAGYTEKDFGSVMFRKRYEPDAIVFYGPKLPLEKGRYSAEIVFESTAASGTVLGQFNIRWRGNETEHWTAVTPGSRAVTVFDQKDNQPFFVAFRFSREADVRVRSVLIKRIESVVGRES